LGGDIGHRRFYRGQELVQPITDFVGGGCHINIVKVFVVWQYLYPK
jgi:hypothetical protein